MNTIDRIFPYRLKGVWVFDDPRHKLIQEPFVGETNLVIDRMLKSKRIRANNCTLQFSRFPFPDFDAVFHLDKVEGKSSWYTDAATSARFWLCPALNHYFDSIPERIYVQISGGPERVTN